MAGFAATGVARVCGFGFWRLRAGGLFLAGMAACGLAAAQQPSGTSASPAPGAHMDQSTVETVGSTPNGSGATVTAPRRSPDAGTALPTVNAGNSLASGTPLPTTKTIGGGGLPDPGD